MGVNRESRDPDVVASSATPTSPVHPAAHRTLGLLLLIGAGGSVGTWTRATLQEAVPPERGGVPWMTLGINVTGSLLLGLLIEVLARTGSDTGWRRGIRLTVGTGFLGGYTTYSTLAVEASQLTRLAPHVVGPAYAVASLVLGPAAAALGYLAAHRLRRSPAPGAGVPR